MAEHRAAEHYVVGSAGHVDHGKSTLVKTLTGIDPDRLAEEKARQMTIDLGFAHLDLPSGRRLGLVDVPGHERFIKNMLAGVGGIDAAMLVIAADEGPMPQTREHLAILDLLGIDRGVIVLTKTDLVDGDWLDLVIEETREAVAGTTLAAAPVVAVSSTTGAGIPGLISMLDQVLDETPARGGGRQPRMPIDRVFSLTGFGTVVTGTLAGGELQVGQELVILPAGLPARVRGLHAHQAKIERAGPGQRVAVNLAGVTVEDVRRGDVLTVAGTMAAARRIDLQLRLLDGSPVSLAQNAAVDLFTGAAETPAWLTLLDRDEIAPGQTGWVQARLRDPIAVTRGDRFIIRRPSPSETLGGGLVVDAAPPRHRRLRPEVLQSLETLAAGAPDELLLHALEASPRDVRSLHQAPPAGVDGAAISALLQELLDEGEILALGADGRLNGPATFVVAAPAWERQATDLAAFVAAHHREWPLRKGMPKESLKSRGDWKGARVFDETIAALVRTGRLVDDGQTVRLPEFQITLDASRRERADQYLTALARTPFTPPPPAEHGIDDDLLGALIDLGEVVKAAEGVVYTPAALRAIERGTIALIERDGRVTLASFRDHFETSRKYAQATLEYLDQRRVTRRVGDERVRFAGAGAAKEMEEA